jgi:hypothetical protein
MVFNLLFYTPFSYLILFFSIFQISPRKYLLEMNNININNLSIILFALHVRVKTAFVLSFFVISAKIVDNVIYFFRHPLTNYMSLVI